MTMIFKTFVVKKTDNHNAICNDSKFCIPDNKDTLPNIYLRKISKLKAYFFVMLMGDIIS